MEASGDVGRGSIGQRHHGANTGRRHQASAHLIVQHDGEQAAVQDAELLAKRPSDNEQWFDQSGYIWKINDQLSDACLELYLSDHAHLEAEVAQRAAQIIVYSDGLGLQQLAIASTAFVVSDCAASSHAPGGKVPPASSAPCHARRCGRSC